jgi:TonB family protein
MFSPLHSGICQYRLAAVFSITLHGLFLLWITHTLAPRIVAPSFVANGDHGTQIAHLYWPNQQVRVASNASPGTSAASATQQLNAHLTWQKRIQARKQAKRDQTRPKLGPDAVTSVPGIAAQVHAAGSPLGTVFEGPLAGDEVRPALPVVSPDPVVGATELNGIQGDVVVEVTIDETGAIVAKAVIQSLAPTIDAKVLEALENWRFRPATRNGVAIGSKQDVYYHFPRLGKG